MLAPCRRVLRQLQCTFYWLSRRIRRLCRAVFSVLVQHPNMRRTRALPRSLHGYCHAPFRNIRTNRNALRVSRAFIIVYQTYPARYSVPICLRVLRGKMSASGGIVRIIHAYYQLVFSRGQPAELIPVRRAERAELPRADSVQIHRGFSCPLQKKRKFTL